MMNKIDHIAIGAATLESGTDWFAEITGISIPKGGQHPLMSTHNGLARLDNSQYIEIMCIDPDAPEPSRPRWFGLDDRGVRQRLEKKPTALAWVVATDDIESLVTKSALPLGEVLELNRGDLNWKFSLPEDGSLLEDGFVPYFIEWPMGKNPSDRMKDVGLSLVDLHMHHPDPDHLNELYTALRIDHLVKLHQSDAKRIEFELKLDSGKTVFIS